MSTAPTAPPAEARPVPRCNFWKTEFERIFSYAAAAIRGRSQQAADF
jgi:hypothetical protein